MKRVCIFILLALSTGLVLADAPKKRSKLTPEERAERRYRRNGGEIEKPIVGNYIAIINPSIVKTADVDKAISSIRELMPFPFKQYKTVGECDSKAVMKIEIVSEKTSDTLTVYPERPGVKINVGALKSDSPSDETFTKRFVKEMWRGLAFSLGAGNSVSMFQSVMKPVVSLKDLDRLKVEYAAPDGFNQMLEMSKKIKLERQASYTYRQACIEGWAPPPTNDIQKAVWDKVRAAPKNPMKIEFDPKKGR